jgi:anionic cell wall polymer biosynthesis LytR-Cps2A-Psr (LCP) family protein
MRTQREFIKATMEQILTKENLPKILDVVNTGYSYLSTNISVNDIKDYIPYAINFDSADLKSEQLPTVGKTLNGLSFQVVNKTAAKTVLNDLFFSDNVATSETGAETTSTSSGTTSKPTTTPSHINKTQ